jgi:23S rRNA pseudouridine2605 synthase
MPATSLLKALMGAGAGSRRRVAEAIMRGVVMVNGRIVEDLNFQVDVARDRVTLDGRGVELRPAKKVYLMLNKPRGVLCTARDERGRKTVLDILPQKYRDLGLHPVGRLDKDTTGLLLLTNDGDFTFRVAHPRFEHEREYFVRIDGKLSAHDVRRLEWGIEMEDGEAHPAVVRELQANPQYGYSVVIREGRKRQVRRTFAALGHRVLELKRVRIGGLGLGELGEGEVGEMGAEEVNQLLAG